MIGECRFCGETHALADGKGRTVIFQAAACHTHQLIADRNAIVFHNGIFYPDWRNVAELFSAYYHKDGSCTGGNLHVVIDDTNIEDSSIHWTRGFCDGKGDQDGAILMTLLSLLPVVDRARISEVVGGRDGQPLREDWQPEGERV